MTDIVKTERRDLSTPRPPSPYAGPRQDDWQQTLTARRLVSRLLRGKRVIAAVFLLVFVPAAVATYMATPLYRSSTIVQVNPDPVHVLPYRDVADPGVGAANYDNYVGTQDQILRGAGLRERVMRRLQTDYADHPAGLEVPSIGGRYSVRKIERSELFELSYVAPTPEAAALVANLFAEEYVKQNFEMRQETRNKAEQELKNELESLEGRLQLSEKDLTTYAQRHDIFSIEQGQVDPLQERLRALNQELAGAEGVVATTRSALQTLEQASVTNFPERLVSEHMRQLEGRLLALEQDLTTLRATFGENWPAVVEKRAETALVQEQLAREKASTLGRHLYQARLDLEGAETRRRLSMEILDEQKALVTRFHDASIQYNILKREVDTNRNLYDGLLQRLRQTGVMAGFQFGNLQIIEAARPSNRQDSPRVAWILGLAALLGLSLGVCGVILWEFWDDSISNLDEVEQLTPLPALGSVPAIKAGRLLPALSPATTGALLDAGAAREDAPAVSAPADRALPFEVTESIRAICASLLLSRSDRRPRVIVVTSATPAEGKTTLVQHLGRAFAEAGLHTLLVEADMRKPDLTKAFSIGNENGLSLYLAGHVSPWPKVHETSVPNLFVAAGGPIPPNPAALLHSKRLTDFLQAAAADYQVVLIDTPPLSMADARIIGTQADGVVLVVRAGRTARDVVRRACSTLEAAGVNMLGMVLNGEEADPTRTGYYGYKYKYGYGYGYGHRQAG